MAILAGELVVVVYVPNFSGANRCLAQRSGQLREGMVEPGMHYLAGIDAQRFENAVGAVVAGCGFAV